MSSITDSLKYQFKQGGMYLKLLYVNVGVFLLVNLLLVIAKLMTFYIPVNELLAVSTNFRTLLLSPWTIITSMFLHVSFMHLLSNMLMLFFIGQMLETYIGSKKILSLYLVGGVIGSLVQILAKNFFPLMSGLPDYPILGASGAVTAIAVGLITYNPSLEVRLFGVIPTKLIYIVGLFFILEFFNLSNIHDSVAHFAHVGGGLFGFFIMWNYRNGKDYLRWMDNLQVSLSNLFTKNKKPKMKVQYSKFRTKEKDVKPPRDDYDYNADKQAKQERLDKILEKIKYKGYDGLTKEEKDFLNQF